MPGTKAQAPAASSLNKASVGAGVPEAVTVKARSTPVVAPYEAPLVKAGAAAAVTATLTVCVATPALLLAVNVKVWVAPPSATGGV